MSIKDWLIQKLGGYTGRENASEAIKTEEERWRKKFIECNGQAARLSQDYIRAVFQAAREANMRKFALVKDAPADTKLPTRKTKGSAGYDFYLPCDVVLEPYGDSPIIQTGVKAYMPEDEVLLLFIRSSVGIMKNVTLSNSVGVIDASYCDNPDNEGNIGLKLHNNSPHTVTFKKGERIMQGVFVKYGVVDDDNATEERKGGIGSTGKE